MKILLSIVDGFGISQNKNALKMQFIEDNLAQGYLLKASEEAVGLKKGQMGNSEVGHMTIGAGRILQQNLTKIDNAITTGELITSPAIAKLKNSNKNLHFMILASDGGVHSHINHLLFLLKIVTNKNCFIHFIADGRDTISYTANKFLDLIEQNTSPSQIIATISGRYYAMDRDNRLDRTAKYYNLLVKKEGTICDKFQSIIEVNYANGITDEFFPASYCKNYPGLSENDLLICCNFRSDRMRQIVKTILVNLPKIEIITMVDYFNGNSAKQICNIINSKPLVETLGFLLSEANKKQLRIAETEKYAHVTFFLNCGNEKPYPGEDRILIPSPRINTYDLQPEMSANLVLRETIEALGSQKYDFICTNFANADMVGHTGNIQAGLIACNTINDCLITLSEVAENNGYLHLITADHGNLEEIYAIQNGIKHTTHTLNPVPFIVIGNKTKKLFDKGDFGLQDVAPTILALMKLPISSNMSGKSLFEII
jgi:2,3-bisphosphoglycerate-independent phosphoglycerate mutase